MTVPARVPRACAICDAANPHLIFRQRFAAIDGASIVDSYDVVACKQCGFTYADVIPDQAAFDAYYRAMSKYEYHQRDGEESVFDRKRMEDIAGDIALLIPSPGSRIVDIGCSTGRLLYLLRERGFSAVTGVDPSRGCVEAADRLYGIPVLQGSMSAFPEIREPFDVVILIGVLEHIRDLDGAMRRVASVVSDGGLVYVEVPNVLDFWRWPNAPFQDFSTEHINFFGPVSLGNLFARYGFDQVTAREHAREQSYRTTMSCLSAAYRKVGGSARAPVYDDRSKPALERYVQQSASAEARLAAVIDELATSGRPFFVWGVGTNATRLLTATRLGEANIQGFVDSNVKYHGKTLADRPVVAPAALRDRADPILILSRVFQREISDQIRATFGPTREILTLYDVE